MEEINSIGRAGEQIGRSVETLRDWDRRGLLRARRDSNGRRYYTDEDIERGRELVKEMDNPLMRRRRSGPSAEMI
jgi:DNA-binding transcriptional MerR regulator